MTLRGCRIENVRLQMQGNTCAGTFSLLENVAVEREILLEDHASSSGSGTYSNRSPG